ncbi:GGDEF domain-containing protein [Alteromonas gracilis]|uniref:GGDEF domain-containing protein n=1 Tax=Alteromonas gracilis TaxID=1479524 RepID=UPI0030CB716E
MYAAMIKDNTPFQHTSGHVGFYKDSSLATMLNFINEAVMVLDINGNIEMLNSQAALLFDGKKDQLAGENLLAFLRDETGRSHSQIIHCLDKASSEIINTPPLEVTVCRLGPSHSVVSVELTLSSLPQALSADSALFLCILRDLTVHKAEYSSLKRKAETDFLTGLANRHKFADYLSQQWAKCEEDDLPLSIIFIDIDHFKRFNDDYGHIMGDRCLKRIGETLNLSLPNRNTLAARYGGEEFALILPNCSAQTAQLLAIRIKRHLAQLSAKHFALMSSVGLTVSMGVATQESHRYETSDALLHAADTLLYQAKSKGRDQICYL